MFTGIVDGVGKIKSIEKDGKSARITVQTGFDLEGVGIGGSVAVEGACLTVTAVESRGFSADISGETLLVTTLKDLRTGDHVNIEKPLTLSTPLGGHIVTGHIDGTGTIKGKKAINTGYVEISFTIPAELMSQVATKGSIAVDGISLTVSKTMEGGFNTVLIPHTLGKTTLSQKVSGDSVNIETDVIAKYVERSLKGCREKGVTVGLLRRHGFIS